MPVQPLLRRVPETGTDVIKFSFMTLHWLTVPVELVIIHCTTITAIITPVFLGNEHRFRDKVTIILIQRHSPPTFHFPLHIKFISLPHFLHPSQGTNG